MKKRFIAVAALGLIVSVAQAEPPAKYNMYCVACHATGAAGAPKTGDKAAWEPYVAQGIDKMLETAKKGKNAMPPMGLCNDCTDAELKEIIEYMSK